MMMLLLGDWWEVVEAYRLGKYDNALQMFIALTERGVVEAYRLGKYDNISLSPLLKRLCVVEAYRLGKYDNYSHSRQ